MLDQGFRREIIEYINAQENKDRRSRSLEDYEVYSGNIKPYVEDKLRCLYTEQSIDEMPIISTINICKKVVDSQASIYKESPDREFINVTPDQKEKLEQVYEDMWFDSKMLTSNRLFKLQQQTHLYIVPKNGRLYARPLKQHQVDVIPNPVDPELGEVYVISGFDKYESTRREASEYNNGQNEPIADGEDYKSTAARYIIWSKDYHFVMNGQGDIISDPESIENPIGIIPIIDISEEKDLEYFIQFNNNKTLFTVEYNEALTKLFQIVELQGFAQAYLKAPEGLMPQNITVGPNRILKIITDPDTDSDSEFGYASPNADLKGSQDFVESLLSQFLSSEGLSAGAVSGKGQTEKFTSGIERLLAMTEKFEATKSDMAHYKQAEKQIGNVVFAWMNVLRDTDLLDDKYKTTVISDDAMVLVNYVRPEVIQTEAEKLDIIERKMDLGLMSRVKALGFLEGKTDEQAVDELRKIQEEDLEFTGIVNGVQETEDNEERSQSEV